MTLRAISSTQINPTISMECMYVIAVCRATTESKSCLCVCLLYVLACAKNNTIFYVNFENNSDTIHNIMKKTMEKSIICWWFDVFVIALIYSLLTIKHFSRLCRCGFFWLFFLLVSLQSLPVFYNVCCVIKWILTLNLILLFVKSFLDSLTIALR